MDAFASLTRASQEALVRIGRALQVPAEKNFTEEELAQNIAIGVASAEAKECEKGGEGEGGYCDKGDEEACDKGDEEAREKGEEEDQVPKENV